MITINGYDGVVGAKPALYGMRNPLNSWTKSDSDYDGSVFVIGDNDRKLAKTLAIGGATHAKYRRMIMVYADINAPLYWWKEFDTYRMGVEKNSCSTMHTITQNPFTWQDFSIEDLDVRAQDAIFHVVSVLNNLRELYIESKDKKYWRQIIQLLPSSYMQTRTVMMSYEAIAHMYHDRRNHKLQEWHDFCDWVEESLPEFHVMIHPEV